MQERSQVKPSNFERRIQPTSFLVRFVGKPLKHLDTRCARTARDDRFVNQFMQAFEPRLFAMLLFDLMRKRLA